MRLVVIAVLCLGCKAAPVADPRVAALDQLREKIGTTARKRSPIEAPLEYTNAYVALELAYGYARLGRPEVARRLIANAKAALPIASDEVHAVLVEAYVARIEQAISGDPPETPLPEPVRARLATLDRVAGYKVDRLREVSAVLARTEKLDAIDDFSKRRGRGEHVTFTAANREVELTRLIARAHDLDPERARLLEGALDEMLALPAKAAAPLLDRAIEAIATTDIMERGALYTRALIVASHFDRTELFPDLLGSIRAGLAAACDVGWATEQTVRVLRLHDRRDELAELATDLERTETGCTAIRGRVARAGALAYLDQAARARSIFDEATIELGKPLTMPARLELTVAIAHAYANAPVAYDLGGIAKLETQLPMITDSFGTNSHFALSVVEIVDAFVVGIVRD